MQTTKKMTRSLNTNAEQKMMLTMNEFQNRLALAYQFGMQYNGDRNLYEALGYPKDLTFEKYFAQYARQDIAAAIINRPVQASWKGDVNVINADDKSETLKKAWQKLYKELKLKNKLSRTDKLSCIGQYGIMLLGFNDRPSIEWKNPVTKSPTLKLAYVTPYSEASATIVSYETDGKNPRYGLPLIYEITRSNNTSTTSLRVHWSRVIHVTGDTLESDVLGIPTLQNVYNRLMDLEKLVGGSAEMFWRNARPGFSGKVDPETTLDAGATADLERQMKAYEHNMRRFIFASGIDINSLSQAVSDPEKHVDVQIQMISAVTGIPKRILTGSEIGELASTQDRNSWISYVTNRREEYCQEQIIIPMVDRLMEYGILPKQEYVVEWPDLSIVSDKDKADVGKVRAEILNLYAGNPAIQEVMPPDMFFKHLMSFTDSQIEEISQFREEMISQLGEATEEEEQIIEDEETEEKKPVNKMKRTR